MTKARSEPDRSEAGELELVARALRGQLELLGESGVTSLPADLAPAGAGQARESARERGALASSQAIPPVSSPTDTTRAPAPEAASFGSAIFQPPSIARLTLEDVRSELGDCTRCPLHRGRTKLVFGTGNPSAEILFVGEGPGEDEDRKGEPFVGRAGQLLTRIIEDGMGLARADVYICNIVKCRPPQNREPEPEEIAACRPFLEKQIASVAPKVIVTLGRPSTCVLLGRAVSIGSVRGKWHDHRGTPLMPTFHPAYVLRRYTPEVRRQVWEDMKEVLAKIGRTPPSARRGTSQE